MRLNQLAAATAPGTPIAPPAAEMPTPPVRRYRTIKSSNYDVNNTCNLSCEGCYYFVSDQKTLNKRPSPDAYDAFFAGEAARGVNYPIFSGGEPSLNPNALRAAARHFATGIIYTNGAKRVPDEVPFRIAVSVWGARELNEKLRGAQSYDRALDTAEGDRRALIYLTISRQNIDDIAEVATDCIRRGIPISFNDFSMTTEYLRLLREGAAAGPYFRMSNADDNLSLRLEDRLRAAEIIDPLIEAHPDMVVFSKGLNDWMHRTQAIHTLDPVTGLATDCAMMNAGWHRSYGYDLQPLAGKPCCAPEFDCSDCRVGPVATFTLLTKLAERMRRSLAARQEFLELRELMMRYHFWDWNTGVEPAPTAS